MASSTAFSTSPPFLSNTNTTTTSNRILSHINLGSHSTHLFSNARRGKLIRTSISAKQGNMNPLQYRKLGDSDLQISEITLGTMTFGEQNTEKEAHEMLSYAFEHGINILDTAEAYPIPMKKETQGKTDLYISSWLNSQPRDKILTIPSNA